MLDTPGKNHTFNCALYQNVHFNIPTTTSFIQSSSYYIPDMNLTRKKKKACKLKGTKTSRTANFCYNHCHFTTQQNRSLITRINNLTLQLPEK